MDSLHILNDYSFASLRAFREAARCESFTVAAMNLSITQSAISHHIKMLEKTMGVKLFYRRGRYLELADEGKLLYEAVNRALETLEYAISTITIGSAKRRIVFGVLSSLATKWLLPRLGSFYTAYPNIELIIRSVNHTIDVEGEQVDLALVTLPRPPLSEKVESILMWRERVFAVCSPAYGKLMENKKRTIADLAGCVLLHDETEIAAERKLDWESWLSHFNHLALLDNVSSQYFSQSDLILQAAINGHGVALTRSSIASTDIKNGLLVNPFADAEMPTETACYLCTLKSLWNEEKINLLREWLIDEIKKDDSLLFGNKEKTT